MMSLLNSGHENPIDIPCYVLAGLKDGYYTGENKKYLIVQQMKKYFVNYEIMFKLDSHLTVVSPPNFSDFLRFAGLV